MGMGGMGMGGMGMGGMGMMNPMMMVCFLVLALTFPIRISLCPSLNIPFTLIFALRHLCFCT